MIGVFENSIVEKDGDIIKIIERSRIKVFTAMLKFLNNEEINQSYLDAIGSFSNK